MFITQKQDQKIRIVINELKVSKEKKSSLKGIKEDISYLLEQYDFIKQEDGWYLGTVESCRRLLSAISSKSFLINNLSTYIWWDTKNNSYTDCLQEYYQYVEERKRLNG